jgi:hypothetical protein
VYAYYALLSHDAAHPSITALNRHFRQLEHGHLTAIVMPPFKPEERLATLDMACDALLGACLAVGAMLGGTSQDDGARSGDGARPRRGGLGQKDLPGEFGADGRLNRRGPYRVRQCITKGAFAELRAACVRRGSTLTGEFLDLEREIDNFALQYEYYPSKTMGVLIRLGKHAGLNEQLASIERKADALREKAFERFSGSVAAPGPFATAEAEALIGAPSPPVSARLGRRSWARYWFGWREAG